MGPEAQPFGLCRPPFVRPHSVMVWSCQHTTKMHHLWWRWGKLGEGGRKGEEKCAPFMHLPVQTLLAGGYGFPASPFTAVLVLNIVKEPLSMATADLTTFPPGGTWPFPQTPPLLSPAGKSKIYSVQKAESDESFLDPWDPAILRQPSTPFQIRFWLLLRSHFSVQEIINAPEHWRFLFLWW